MTSRLWYMNADFENELAASAIDPAVRYRRPSSFDLLNHRLAPHLLRLARPGDRLLIDEPPSAELADAAARRAVELVSTQITTRTPSHGSHRASDQSSLVFTPWGWTRSAIELGRKVGAIVEPVALDVVTQVNSKLWSFNLECELGVRVPGACAAATFDELQAAVARTCPGAEDKWVIKSPFGFAARERVLGRGAVIGEAQGKWARKRFSRGETLIFQPWLEVTREYGVTACVSAEGAVEIFGVSDLRTNGAGTGTGYLLGRPLAPGRREELEQVARFVGARLFREGYTGAFGVDALEHSGGLHPLLEVNARYTMGFVALAVERELKPSTPVFWSTK